MIELSIKRLLRTSCTAVICLLGGVQVGVGAEVDFELRLGGTYSDNARRSAQLETSETIATAGVWLDVVEQTKRFDGSLVANIDHNVYTDDTFADETVASVVSNAELQLVPRILSWAIADNYGKLKTDPFRADTPANRENVNRFSTGPNLTIRLGSRTAVEIGGQYKNTQFEISNFDNDGLSGNITLVRELSEARSISLNVSADRIEYADNAINSNFDVQSAYLALQSRNSRGKLSASLGINEFHDNGVTSDGLLANISLSREISSSSSFSLNFDQRFSSTGNLLERLRRIEKRGDGSLPILGSTGPLEISSAGAGYRFEKGNNEFNLSLSQGRYDYDVDTVIDRDFSELRLDAVRQIGVNWRAEVSARVWRTEYDQSLREDDDLEISLLIGRHLTRTLGIDIVARRINRDSNAVEFNYAENRYTLQVVYTPSAR